MKLTSWGRPKDVTLQMSLSDVYIMPLWCCRKNVKLYSSQFFSFFRHIFGKKIENNAIEMHLVREVQNWVKGTSKGRYPKYVFSRRFEDICRTIFQNCKNMQQLTFQYFTQHICWSKIKIYTIVMCFAIYFQIGVLGTSRGGHFRTLLGSPWNTSPQFMKI